MANTIIVPKKMNISAITSSWAGAIASCKALDNGSTEVTFDDTSPVPAKTVDELIASADNYVGKKIILQKIKELEDSVTPRRLRDALANDEGKAWVAAVELKIKTERDKL